MNALFHMSFLVHRCVHVAHSPPWCLLPACALVGRRMPTPWRSLVLCRGHLWMSASLIGSAVSLWFLNLHFSDYK